ncbi:SMP-30/gluconolactonase/LRE family protein [Aristophania vespae]|uniref:SMP-30/gluconolactonase/LRE family protein n=1 Tax=Aristophania vespae TaxID=2697033 RepID=A0A6P1NFZ4_9PROT|nr:SMP-30/gluconolactonase/LRE family protein [Aristophania vespae]QHI96358.1 SMP-30/gluconolactonase/LRE family protein [Aristophania vespae]
MKTSEKNKPACVLDLKAQLGEGPIWIAKEKALYFVDIIGETLHRFNPTTQDLTSWKAPSRIAFILPVSNGSFLVGMPDGLHHFDAQKGAFSQACFIEPDKPGNRLNDGCVDQQGRIWFGTMDDDEEKKTGSIYRVEHKENSLQLSHWDEGYIVSNGPAVSPCGTVLYVSDSPQQRIYAFDLDKSGALKGKRLFATLDHGYPDGLVTDSQGNLWCGTFGGGRIVRFKPDGTELPFIPMPVSNVTKIAFGGDDYRTVFVTTARKGLSSEELAKEPLAGGLFAFRTDIAGTPQKSFLLNQTAKEL